MPRFGKESKEKLLTCHRDLQVICNEIIKYYDIKVIEGHRSLQKQQEYFKNGLSELNGLDKKSKHQSYPSLAVDIMPYKKGTNAFKDEEKERARFYQMAGYMLMASEYLYKNGEIEHKLRWGGDWDSDKTFKDQNFHDLPHFELYKP